MTLTEHLHFQSGEVSIPFGFTVKDLNPVILTWDMVKYEEFNSWFVQFVVGPGVLMERHGALVPSTWMPRKLEPPKRISLLVQDRLDQPPVDEALERTSIALDAGYQWQVKPIAFSLDPEDFSEWPKERALNRADPSSPVISVETVGDAIASNDPEVIREVFNATFAIREKGLRKKRKRT